MWTFQSAPHHCCCFSRSSLSYESFTVTVTNLTTVDSSLPSLLYCLSSLSLCTTKFCSLPLPKYPLRQSQNALDLYKFNNNDGPLQTSHYPVLQRAMGLQRTVSAVLTATAIKSRARKAQRARSRPRSETQRRILEPRTPVNLTAIYKSNSSSAQRTFLGMWMLGSKSTMLLSILRTKYHKLVSAAHHMVVAGRKVLRSTLAPHSTVLPLNLVRCLCQLRSQQSLLASAQSPWIPIICLYPRPYPAPLSFVKAFLPGCPHPTIPTTTSA